MRLWRLWFTAVGVLRPACARQRTYGWMVVVLLGLSLRLDLAGVTSFVRVLGLAPAASRRPLHLVHSPALALERLTALWTRWCRDAFPAFTVGAARVCLADGLKAPKEGRKMRAVKKLHQESGNNSKPPFIVGHSFQCLALLTPTAGGHAAAVPLAARICEGVVWSNRDQRTQLDRLVLLSLSVAAPLAGAVVLVADAYYASGKVMLPLLAGGHHLVTRARKNAVAYAPAPRPTRRRRGRPRLYGPRVRLRELLADPAAFTAVSSPVYGETDVTIAYRCVDLLGRPVGRLVRFVLVRHPTHGTIMLMTTDVTMDPLDVIILYGYIASKSGASSPPTTATSSSAASRRACCSTSPSPPGRPSGSSSAAGCARCTPSARRRNSSWRMRSARACPNVSPLGPRTLSSQNSCGATSSDPASLSLNLARRSRYARTWHSPVRPTKGVFAPIASYQPGRLP